MSDISLSRSTKRKPAAPLGRIGSFFKQHSWSYLFVLPSMLVFSVFTLFPILWALVISFQDSDLVTTGNWIGFKNYVTAFTTGNGVFGQSIINTLYYTVITVVANIFIALILAALIQKRGKVAKTFFLAAFYLPAVCSTIIIATTWKWIFNSEYGLLNYLLGLIHIAPVRWLSDPNIVLNSITLSTVLTIPATGVVLFNAAMAGIPPELYEAAQLDGAGPIQRWWYITLPLIKSTTLYLVVLYTIASFQVFEKFYIMVKSGVGTSTDVMVTQIYQNGFQQMRFGVASAQAFVLFLMIAIVSVVQFRFLRSDVEY
ncbi:carbohydrate ABC transporter permease [Ktedonospora formicarum]|uniref:Sugar ABC transporter permease n=1 Tax=Ktedonospora formicarum TaxID=2778364 RepID=A0A8J3HRL6_9CHLR|nr:sugar ABC transporter permease [Ktedonospora formicarum]GHO42344.1 sugar ABC transporter permease [Ktedonospora formicarum]